MECCRPGLPVHHQLPELAQTRIHWVSDAIQPPHPLSSTSPPFNLFQHQGLFKWVTSSHQMAKVLKFQLRHHSFQWISGLISFRIDWLDLLAVQGTLRSLQRFTHGGIMSMVPFQLVPLYFSCCVHVWLLYWCKYCLKRYIWNLQNDIFELIYWAELPVSYREKMQEDDPHSEPWGETSHLRPQEGRV